jgi:tetratricopeptide (TPR) repeat protein
MDAQIKKLSEESIQMFQKKKFAEAADGFRTCIAALEKASEPLDLAEMKNNLCVVLIQMGEYQQALDAAIRTDQPFAEAGDTRRQGVALANQGNALEMLKRYDEAISYYEKARDCLRASGEKQMLAITLKSLSDLQLKTGRKFEAVNSLQDSYEQNPDGKIKNKFFAKTIKELFKKITGR